MRALRQEAPVDRRFLPRMAAEVMGCFRVSARHQPALHIGGDFYDVVRTSEDGLVATIGNVSGKRRAGALLLSCVMSALRRITEIEHVPDRVLARLDLALEGQIADDPFVTCACARLDARAGLVTIANAAHVLPLLRRASGKVQRFGSPAGPPLPMITGRAWMHEIVEMQPGDVLLLVTDGLLAALHTKRDPLGRARKRAWRSAHRRSTTSRCSRSSSSLVLPMLDPIADRTITLIVSLRHGKMTSSA